MWTFFDKHPLVAAIALGLALVIAVLIVIIMIRAIKSGDGVEAEAGRDGVKFRLNKKEIQSKKDFEADIIRDAALLSSSIINWKSEVSKEIDKKTNETISNCIRYAVTRIENMVNVAKLEYGDMLKKKKDKLTTEDNYQVIIYGFLMDQVKETFKDQICSAIRADHFEEKSEAEIKAIGDNCYLLSKLIFEQRLDILQRDILLKVAEKYEPKIKKEADELVDLTEQKYKNLKKEIEETISEREEKFRVELKLKFPNFTDEITDQLVNYYS